MGQVFQKEFRFYSLSGKWKNDADTDDLDLAVAIYQPESLEHLLTLTKFTRRELKLMYRGFKQACPSGFITIEDFKDIFARIFPHGDSSTYADYVFHAVGGSSETRMTFADVAVVLSTLSRGSVNEKLEWTFQLYDVDRDGYISFNELLRVMFAVYNLLGDNTEPPPDRFFIKARAKEIFKAMDINGSGRVTRGEFVQACLENPELCESLEVFNTIL